MAREVEERARDADELGEEEVVEGIGWVEPESECCHPSGAV